jgi:hypothetical protein
VSFFSTILISLAILFGLRDDGSAAESFTIGVIQYNVKGGSGGWKNASGVLDAQFGLIKDQIRSNQVDFIALEQAGDKPGKPEPIISNKLAESGLKGWRTITSVCYPDTTQLAFSSSWEPAAAPLANGDFPQPCWKHGRPYNIVLLKSKKSALQVLFVVTHMPHCEEAEHNWRGCLKSWKSDQFAKDLAKVLGAVDYRVVNLIMAGDLNELGELDPNVVFNELLVPIFGKLQISSALNTCCSNSNWIYSYDRIVANSSRLTVPELLGVYPHGSVNEEHKAIYGTVAFSSR